MSSDSTELTFVRCPSCRSLVPAMSKTCRMCGAGLDGSTKSGDDTDKKSGSGRVRQRTTFRATEEISSAVSKIREDAAEQFEHGSTPVVADGESVEDPLSAYIEEIEADDEKGSTRPDLNASERGNQGGLRENGEMVADAEVDPLLQRARRPSGEAIPHSSQNRQTHALGDENLNEGKTTIMSPGDSREPPLGVSSPMAVRENRVTKVAPTLKPAPEISSDEVVRHEIPSGSRLTGWLVSYKDANGSAIELREGKFFISRARMKESDLVVDDPSVSTPHALCAVGADNTMKVQDLMSDGGVFLRRLGEESYVRLTETTSVGHGDWIKFGDSEFTVCLIAHRQGGN